jgi:hypothetical protein
MAEKSDADEYDDYTPSNDELLALFREYHALTEKVEAAVSDRDEEIIRRLGLPLQRDGESAAEYKFRMRGFSAYADRIRAEMPAVSDDIKSLDNLVLILADALIQSQGLSIRQVESLAMAMLKIVHDPACIADLVYPWPSGRDD